MNMLNHILDSCGFSYDEIFGMFKKSPYDKIYVLGETAVEKFGKDPKIFKKTLGEYKPKNYGKAIKEAAKNLPSGNLRFNSWDIRDYINCLTAILQVDLECPGFMKNFPEAIEFLNIVNSRDLYRINNKFESLYGKIIKSFNRYSGKSDFKYVKSLFEIPETEKSSRYDELAVRFDDYMSIEFQRFWKSGNEEQKDYLKKYYIHSEILLPEDYRGLIRYIGIPGKEVTKDLEEGDMKWVDLYFEYQDQIIEAAHKEIHVIAPPIMKKINLTLT